MTESEPTFSFQIQYGCQRKLVWSFEVLIGISFYVLKMLYFPFWSSQVCIPLISNLLFCTKTSSFKRLTSLTQVDNTLIYCVYKSLYVLHVLYCTVARRSHRNVHNDSPETCLSQSYQLWLTDRLLFGPSSLDACENVFRSVERLYFRRWKIKKWKLMAMLCKLISSLSPKCSESSYLFNNFIPLKTQGTNSDTVHVNLNAWPQICASYLYYVDIYSL